MHTQSLIWKSIDSIPLIEIGIGDDFTLCRKRPLDNNKTLSDLNIKDGDTIIAVENMLGGWFLLKIFEILLIDKNLLIGDLSK